MELSGITVREARPGWVTLDLPPLERWAEPFRWLTPPQKERINTPEFFELLQREITRRFLAQKPSTN